MLINNAVITGSFIVNGVDVTGITGSSAISSSYLALSSSYVITSASYAQSSASLSIRTSNLEATSSTLVSASSSFAAQSASLSTRLTGDEANISTLTTASASFAVVSASFSSTSQSVSSRVTLIEGQYATTGSNIFSGPQYVNQASNAIGFASTASLYTNGGLRVTKDSFVSGTAYFNNVVVYGTSSIQYITSSQVNFGTNIITVNTDTPAVRFGGLAVFDSGSTQLTGSILWDSQNNHWIYSNPSGSSYNSAMLMNGPRNTGSLGSEQGTTNNALMKGQGGDHITSSQIIDDGTTVRIPGALQVTGSLIGSSTATFASSVTAGNGFVATGYPAASGNGLFIAYNSAGSNTGSLYSYNYSTSTYNPTILDGSNVYIYNSGVVKMAVVGGNVGIGTSSPNAILEVGGLAVDTTKTVFRSSLAVAPTAYYNDITAIYSGASAQANKLQINYANGYTSGTGIVLQGDGNVGIGISTPNTKLDVNGVINIRTNGYEFGRITTNNTTATDGGLTFQYITSGTFTEGVKLFSTGNLSIGASPTDSGYKLDVNGTGRFSGVLTVSGNLNLQGAVTRNINFYDSSNTNINAQIQYDQISSNSGQLFFGTNNAGTFATRLTIASTGAATFSSSVTAVRGFFNSGGNETDPIISVTGDTNTGFYFPSADTINVTTSGTKRVSISSTGNFSVRSNVASNTIAEFWNDNTSNGYGIYVRGGQSSADYAMNVVDTNGTTLLKARGDGAIFFVGGYPFTTASGANLWIDSSGVIQKNVSSIKFKKDVQNYNKGLIDLMKLRPVSYLSKSEIDSPKRYAGMIAEELYELGFTEYVNLDEKGEPESISYASMVALLTKSIQELSAKVDAQAAEINELKNK